MIFSHVQDVTVPVSYTHLDVYKRQECIRYGEGIADQLMKPCAQQMVEVDEVDVKEIVYHIDYEPQKNAYLLNQKQKLEAELETLSPESDRYHRICLLYTSRCV